MLKLTEGLKDYKLIPKGIADKPYGLVKRGWGADLFISFFHK